MNKWNVIKCIKALPLCKMPFLTCQHAVGKVKVIYICSEGGQKYPDRRHEASSYHDGTMAEAVRKNTGDGACKKVSKSS